MNRFTVLLMTLSVFFVFTFDSLIAQTNWTGYPGNPIMLRGSRPSWESNSIYLPIVLIDDNQFIMFYSGYQLNDPIFIPAIGRATSPDGITWTKYEGNPILTSGSSGEWDAEDIFMGPTLVDSSGYKLWYEGNDGTNSRIGLATSQNGIDWEKYEGNPVLDLGDSSKWDDSEVARGAVLYHESIYKMWYVGGDGENLRLGYATSPDGINWTKYEENPVLDIGETGAWDDGVIWHSSVIFNGNTYEMWYEGNLGITGYASSPDGITWTKYWDNPVLNRDLGSVLLDGSVYRLWHYSGSSIGYAEDFSNIAHSDSLALNCIYAQPTLDTVLVNAWVENPNDQDLTVKAFMANDDSVLIDSTELTDQGEGLWQGWSVPEDEGLYRVWIETTDEESETIHNGMHWRNEIFCTNGPVKFDSYQITSEDTIPNPGDRLKLNLNLINNGKTSTVTDISLKATNLDTLTSLIYFSDPQYGDIAPGEIAEPSRSITFVFNADCPDSIYAQIKVDIYCSTKLFWSDTFSVFVQQDPSGLVRSDANIPSIFALNQNYPNPFNPKTIINYELPTTNFVELSIFNMLGQKVATLVNEQKRAGYHHVEWDANGFSSGVYYYRIKSGEFVDVKKMILLR